MQADAPPRAEGVLLFLAPLTRGGRGGWFSRQGEDEQVGYAHLAFRYEFVGAAPSGRPYWRSTDKLSFEYLFSLLSLVRTGARACPYG